VKITIEETGTGRESRTATKKEKTLKPFLKNSLAVEGKKGKTAASGNQDGKEGGRQHLLPPKNLISRVPTGLEGREDGGGTNWVFDTRRKEENRKRVMTS